MVASTNVAYIIVRAEPRLMNCVSDHLRARIKAHIRRVMAPDQTLVVTLELKGETSLTEQLRDAILTIEQIPGVIRSETRIGNIRYSASEIPRSKPVGWMFIRTGSDAGLGPALQRLQLIEGIVQVAELAPLRYRTPMPYSANVVVVYQLPDLDSRAIVEIANSITNLLGDAPGAQHPNYDYDNLVCP